jgi:ankyrin repeat protein
MPASKARRLALHVAERLILVAVLSAAIIATVVIRRAESVRGPQAVRDAIAGGDAERLRSVLELRPYLIDHHSADGSLLHAAVRHDRPQMIEFLLRRGCGPDARARGGWTPLHLAVQRGALDAARILLDAGADVSARTANERTPLHLAIGNEDLMRLLLRRGADPFARDRAGAAPVELVFRCDEPAPVLPLLERRIEADPAWLVRALRAAEEQAGAGYVRRFVRTCRSLNRPSTERGYRGMTLLHLAALEGDQTLVLAALDAGARLGFQDCRGRTPLDLALGDEPDPDVRRGRLSVLFALLRSRAPGSARTVYAALECALQHGRSDLVESYLRGLVRVDRLRDPAGRTLLHLAVAAGHLDLTARLLNHGARLDAWNWTRRDALHVAVTSSRNAEAVVRLLLEHGADPNAQDLYERNTLHAALVAGAELAVVRRLIDAGANVNHRCIDQLTPLNRAAAAGDKAAIELLLDKGVDINQTDPKGCAAIHYAAMQNRLDIARMLLERGCWHRQKDHSGARPIRHSINGGFQEMTELLAEYHRKQRGK